MANGKTPSQRKGPCHNKTHIAASVTAPSIQSGGVCTGRTAPGHAAITSATAKIQINPHSNTAQTGAAKPMGVSKAAITAPGMMMLPITGTLSRLAISP